jgi:Zn-dependent protease
VNSWGRESPGTEAESWREPPRLDEPLSWSVPVARLGRTIIRAHALLLGTIIVIFVRAAWHVGEDAFPLGPRLAAIMLAAMVFVVTMHELATLWVTRRLGGDLPEIVLQPLGGLDDGVPPPGWRRAAIAAMVGPLVAATIAAVAALVVAIGTRDTATSGWGLPGLHSPAVAGSLWLETMRLLGSVAAVVAFANLLPAPPFRGRLLVEALLRPHLGPTRARRAAFRIGVATAVAVGAAGIVSLWLPVFLVAALCGLALLREHRRDADVQAAFSEDGAYSIADLRTDAAIDQEEADAEASLARRRREQSEARVAAENAELDRVLDKIAELGIDALDRHERRILDRATRRRRGDGGQAERRPSDPLGE